MKVQGFLAFRFVVHCDHSMHKKNFIIKSKVVKEIKGKYDKLATHTCCEQVHMDEDWKITCVHETVEEKDTAWAKRRINNDAMSSEG